MRMKSWIFLIITTVLAACGNKPLEKISIAGEAQGTYYAITYYDKLGRDLQEPIDSLLKAVDKSVSLWDDNSIITRVNRGDTSVKLDKIFIYNFILSKEMGILSNGYFDFTIGPLAGAWGFHRKNKLTLSSYQVDSLKQLVDFRKVRIENGQIIKDDPRMSFDFNAVAQGYTVDLIASMLDSLDIKHFVVDVGGEIIARNKKPGGSSWRVGIESPSANKDDDRTIQVVVSLENKGLATSGSYRKYFEQGGKRYSHAIDPKTGYSVDHHLMSVTVLADNAAYADALATTFMVMGMEKSLKLMETLTDVDAYFIYWTKENIYETYASEGMKKLIVN
ncbi:MAG: thiamine biosynthesis protein ApbE [Bacteroidetes bacterium HGW-Bacteroidetes-1]|nr:MAG: thiamine biosynthesis protein ApbE [Bacteroidetes bacterium HGW-Bacteroidetes-1]